MRNDVQEKGDGFFDSSNLLEIAAANDLISFKRAVEGEGCDVDVLGLWYGRKLGSKMMGFEERTPLMIASLYGSKDVLRYILGTGRVEINKASGSDGATALHCAAAGGSSSSAEVIKLLLDAHANRGFNDFKGRRPADVIGLVINGCFYRRRKEIESMLKDGKAVGELYVLPDQIVIQDVWQEPKENTTPKPLKEGSEKKEYPVDLTLPDINDGIYGTDEFRMYTFKIKPCSRAYSHDWTECPFIHPGENARRRDPRKYHYTCVPCPEFRKGSCKQGDNCEYAHGIFECWLHPAQYRTRLCKDEINCTRKVCFFAHRPEELRPLYASTGSAIPSPRSYSMLDSGPTSPIPLASPSGMMQASTTPLTSPGSSTSIGGWPSQSVIAPPILQGPGSSRLKSARGARGMSLDMKMLGMENQQRQQQLIDDVSGLYGLPSFSSFGANSGNQISELNRLGGVTPSNLEDLLRTLEASESQIQSPNTLHMVQNVNQMRSSYPSPIGTSPPYSMDGTATNAPSPIGSRPPTLPKKSQSFAERNPMNHYSGLPSPASTTFSVPSNISDWGSPDGKLNWSIDGDELNKLRKSASFVNTSNNINNKDCTSPTPVDEPGRSYVQSLVSEEPQSRFNVGDSEVYPAWVEQFCLDQEQMVA